MIARIRVILETEKDVFRDIEINENDHLESLHFAIIQAYSFDGFEMASFFLADENWHSGQEIPLLDMSDTHNKNILLMNQVKISSVLKDLSSKLVYVYDFMNMWRFYVQLVSKSKESSDTKLPSCVLSFGELPQEAPTCIISDGEWQEEDDFDNTFDDFDDLDQNIDDFGESDEYNYND